MKENKRGLSKEQEQTIQNAFDTLEQSGNRLDASELELIMAGLGIEPNKEDVKHLILEISHNGTLDRTRFTSLMTEQLLSNDSTRDMLTAFKLFERDSNGNISLDSLKKVAVSLGETMTDDQLK
eukprot:Ihof_evm2s434 gene=Ihof_evmTU2s434